MHPERQKNRIQKALSTFWSCCYATYDIGIYALNGRALLSSLLFVPFGAIWGAFHGVAALLFGYTFDYAPLDAKGHGPAYNYFLQRDLPSFKNQIQSIKTLQNVEDLYKNHAFSFALFEISEIKALLAGNLDQTILRAIALHIANDSSLKISESAALAALSHQTYSPFPSVVVVQDRLFTPRGSPIAQAPRIGRKASLVSLALSSEPSELDADEGVGDDYEQSVETLFTLLESNTDDFIAAANAFVIKHPGRDAERDGVSILAKAIFTQMSTAVAHLQSINKDSGAQGAPFKYKANDQDTLDQLTGLAKGGNVEALSALLNSCKDNANLELFLTTGEPKPELLCQLITLGLLGREGDDSSVQSLILQTAPEGLKLFPIQIMSVIKALDSRGLSPGNIVSLLSVTSIIDMLFSVFPEKQDSHFDDSELEESEESSELGGEAEYENIKRSLIGAALSKLSTTEAYRLFESRSWDEQQKLIPLLGSVVDSSRVLYQYPALSKLSLLLLNGWERAVEDQDKKSFIPDIINIFMPIALVHLFRSQASSKALPASPTERKADDLLKAISNIVKIHGQLDEELTVRMVARILAKGPVRNYELTLRRVIELFEIKDLPQFAEGICEHYRTHLEQANKTLNTIESECNPKLEEIRLLNEIASQTPMQKTTLATLQKEVDQLIARHELLRMYVADSTHLINLLAHIRHPNGSFCERPLITEENSQILILARISDEYAETRDGSEDYKTLTRLMPTTRFKAFLDTMYNPHTSTDVRNEQKDVALAQFFEIFRVSIDAAENVLIKLNLIDITKKYACIDLEDLNSPASSAILYIVDRLVQAVTEESLQETSERIVKFLQATGLKLSLNEKASTQVKGYIAEKLGISVEDAQTILAHLNKVIAPAPALLCPAFNRKRGSSFSGFVLPPNSPSPPSSAETGLPAFFSKS